MIWKFAIFISRTLGDIGAEDGPRPDGKCKMIDPASPHPAGCARREAVHRQAPRRRHFNLKKSFRCRFAAGAVPENRGYNFLLLLATTQGAGSLEGP
jgi:hypothetical protein